MSRSMILPRFSLSILLSILSVGSVLARSWTDVNGRTIDAELTGVDSQNRALLKTSQKVVAVPLDQLSPSDRKWVKNWVTEKQLANLSAQTSRTLEEAAKPPVVAPSPNPRAIAAQTADGAGFFPRSRDQVQSGVKAILARRSDGLKEGEQAALNRLNAYRFLCGLPHDVAISRDFQPMVDGAARICKAIGKLDHGPANPGWPEAEYQQARRGAGTSNLYATSAGGGVEIAPASVDAYLDDGATNPNLGHRRWCLNPRMGLTAFGAHEGYCAMWAMDGSGEDPKWKFVAFPSPGYFPRDFFGKRYQWNITFNPEEFRGFEKLTASDIKVYKLRSGTVDSADGRAVRLEYFNVNLDGFGVPNSVGFLPEDVDLDKGDRYRVEIHGMAKDGMNGPLVYVVEFF
jgi:hypothetical protein